MPYYTFNIYSTKKDVLTKQFTTQDCLDLHYLLANRDYVGVDIFCQLKFEEYSNVNAKLDSFDKFLYLLSQKILSHNFDTSVIHSNSESNSKITKIITKAVREIIIKIKVTVRAKAEVTTKIKIITKTEATKIIIKVELDRMPILIWA